MRNDIVFTLTGPDRVGIVDDVSAILLDLGGNVSSSRMARLGGEFAILMLVSLPAETVAGVEDAFKHMTAQGYKITTSPTEEQTAKATAQALYKIQVEGADHEGIIHDIAQGLSDSGINIESMETSIVPASVSGAPLFRMSALLSVPANVEETDWIEAVTTAGDQSGVDVEVTIAD